MNDGNRKSGAAAHVVTFAASVGAVVVGGIILEHLLRLMDAGRFHVPGIGYWRPGPGVRHRLTPIVGGLK